MSRLDAFDFEQEIIRKADSKIIATAINTGACISTRTGRPVVPEALQKICEADLPPFS